MPNDEELSNLLKWLASCIDGLKTNEIFTILTGSGRNGKERPSSSSPCPQHSLAIQCNAIPSLDGEDDAIWD
ncbi:hypothetical protein BDK51DRAFT_36957 [Blyttiomyces helicus]|uniref:Uncharacterized protein n=1 Tax=Blyttiomyces helicus TaxID=388810 RepID=A0A4P9VWQ0_9FUNG|nr:hypothetical protein BDK51DRAFT_36957 [Blyttiomyces helicus]|eukprot:RKO83285.1 hypothetical protein BDK51DRAFT_36957 [Blyttiomyces helicus]